MERFTLTALDGVAARFGAVPPDSVPRFNIAPLQHALIRTAGGITSARWGLLPPWRGHGGKRAPHVTTARVDELDATPLLRNAFKKQRCLVIADGFFHWRQLETKTQPLWLHAAEGARPLGFAAVAATHRDDDQPSFAILRAPTRVPFDGGALWLEAPIVIDDDPAWLAGSLDAAKALLAPSTAWRAEPVSTYVNTVAHDDARCVAPLRNPLQGQLF